MTDVDAAQLELLAEIDALVGRLRRWVTDAPPWQPAETSRALVGRLADRAERLRVRVEAPLVVATLGGTGTGKSALVNALLGAEVVAVGRTRPTTSQPTLIVRPGLSASALGIEPQSVQVVEHDAPLLRDMVLLDCPDPDTTEEYGDELTMHTAGAQREAATNRSSAALASSSAREALSTTNLERLRRILPHCDVLLVTTTQQKYRSAKIADELAMASRGARLVFVQTHADLDDDIREDWREVLGHDYSTAHIFRVDSPAALADAQEGRQPRGELAALLELLARQRATTAQIRIRRANFLDLAADTLQRCRVRLDEQLPAAVRAQDALDERRAELTARLAAQMRTELLGSRYSWESRLMDKTISRWGFSPFALVLRLYQGLGGLVSGMLLWRVRTPAQLALWGAVTGTRTLRQRRRQAVAGQSADRALTQCWDQAELRSAALVLEGFVAEAGLPREDVGRETIDAEAAAAGANFVGKVAGDVESLLTRLAARHTGWFTRALYELLFLAMFGGLLFRLGKDFFWDSFLRPNPVPPHGLDLYLVTGFWLVLWCVILIWALTGRLRRGLRRQLDQLAGQWSKAADVTGLFARLESDCRAAARFCADLRTLEAEVGRLRQQLAAPDADLSSRR
jgi:hypothetical protein